MSIGRRFPAVFFAAASLAAPAAAQVSLRMPALPALGARADMGAASAGALRPGTGGSLLLPAVPTLSPVPAPSLSPVLPGTRVKLAARIEGMGAKAVKLSERLRGPGPVSAADGRSAGREFQELLTGEASIPVSSFGEPSEPAASQDAGGLNAPAAAELDFAVQASVRLAALADDLADSRGLKAGAMTGAQFIGVLEDAREQFISENRASAPSSEALEAAAAVQASVIRAMKALLQAEQPLTAGIRRALAVWDVFNQEMARAARESGTLKAVEADAALFASQVEASL